MLLFDIVIDVPVVGRAVFHASARAVRTWNLDIISWPRFWLSLVRFICRLRSTRCLDFSGDDFQKMFPYSSYALVDSG